MKKLLVLILSLTLCLGLLSFTGCSQEENSAGIEINQNGISETVWDIFDGSSTSGFGIKMLTSQTVVTENEKYLEKTLQATVSGSLVNAKPVELEWNVVWYGESEKNINDYLIVEQSLDDQTICTVRLYQAIEETAVITVSCKNNGISASCLVEYSPKSYSTKFVGASGLPISEYDTLEGQPAIELIPGQVVEFSMRSFDFFGNDIGVSKTLEVNGSDSIGSINMTYLGVAGQEFEHSLSEFVNPVNSSAITPYIIWDFNRETGILRIEAVTALENLEIAGFSPLERKKYYSTSSNVVPYFKIDLVDNSNFEVGVQFFQVLVRVESPVSLSLNNSNITFE